VRASQSRPQIGDERPPGHTFMLRADLISPEARALLGAVARVVLVGDRGRLVDQLERAPVHSSTIVRYKELYRWPLAVGILALFAELGIVAWKAPLP